MMATILPEFEYVDRATQTIRYLEHGWPTDLCRWHSHPEYELHLIVSTRGKVFVGDYIGTFQTGSLYLIGPNLPHNWVTESDSKSQPVTTRDMLVQFGQDSINQLRDAFVEFQELTSMLELASYGIEFVGFDLHVASWHLRAIRDARGAERIVALLRFLIEINEHAKKETLSVGSILPPENNSRQARIADVVDHITEHFAESQSLGDAAKLAGMSPAGFSRMFQRVTGCTFVEFVNRVRIAEACARLYTTDDQISSIGYDVGFRNLANFNRTFLKMKDMSPKAFRELGRRELISREGEERRSSKLVEGL